MGEGPAEYTVVMRNKPVATHACGNQLFSLEMYFINPSLHSLMNDPHFFQTTCIWRQNVEHYSDGMDGLIDVHTMSTICREAIVGEGSGVHPLLVGKYLLAILLLLHSMS